MSRVKGWLKIGWCSIERVLSFHSSTLHACECMCVVPDDADGASGDLSPMARDLPTTDEEAALRLVGSLVWHFGHSFLSALEA